MLLLQKKERGHECCDGMTKEQFKKTEEFIAGRGSKKPPSKLQIQHELEDKLVGGKPEWKVTVSNQCEWRDLPVPEWKSIGEGQFCHILLRLGYSFSLFPLSSKITCS
ncbi:hypothetical protein QYF36_001385 [Acer negundo]|nr:hypothetical protein QYF36_001385 [Acer negundo]